MTPQPGDKFEILIPISKELADQTDAILGLAQHQADEMCQPHGLIPTQLTETGRTPRGTLIDVHFTGIAAATS